MSEISVNIKTGSSELCLPVNYHHVLQSVVYNLMRDESEGISLHDNGQMLGKRKYKLFTFGLPKGNFRREKDRLVFSDFFSLEIRAWDGRVIEMIRKNAENNGVRFGSTIYHDISCEASETQIQSDDLIISMLSPICAYITEPVSRNTHFFRPGDAGFISAVVRNFQRKYEAATGAAPRSDVTFSVIDVRSEDKCVTRYKDFIIEGHKGTYRLKGATEYLTFLYDTGLGAKNSQGFGMFRVIE